MENFNISNIDQTANLSSGITKACDICGATLDTEDRLGDAINHYLEHGWILLHVGGQSSWGPDGKVWTDTVAIVGRP